jgi:DNA-binding NarL/FixJ family response regulator
VAGVALAGAGKVDRAIEELAVAENLFGHYGARRFEREVAEQRRRIDARIRSGPIRNGVASLTARELQVATLVTEGLTNRQVAARLFVTVKTVEMHLSHVFVKLGVSNRAGLVREVALAGA